MYAPTLYSSRTQWLPSISIATVSHGRLTLLQSLYLCRQDQKGSESSRVQALDLGLKVAENI